MAPALDLPRWRAAWDWRSLRRVADPASVQRGEEYAREGRVALQVTGPLAVEAVVTGERTYRVGLALPEDEQRDPVGEAEARCSCPLGTRRVFCKHLVATALVATGRVTPQEDVDEPDVAAYLASLDHEELVALLLARADEDEVLARQLALAAAAAAPGGPDLAALRRAVDEAFEVHGRVGWRDARGWWQRASSAADAVRTLLEDGYADEAAEIAEHALVVVEQTVDWVDDREGLLRGLADELIALHLAACARSRPDPVALARSVYAHERDTRLDLWVGAAEGYAAVLGSAGLAEYQRLARADLDRAGAGSGPRGWRARQALEAAVRASSDA